MCNLRKKIYPSHGAPANLLRCVQQYPPQTGGTGESPPPPGAKKGMKKPETEKPVSDYIIFPKEKGDF